MTGQEYIDKLKQKLSGWDESIQQLQESAQQADAQAQAEYNRQIAAIKEKREDLSQQLEEIKGASGERWDDIVASIQDTVGSLEEKISNLLQKGK